VKTPMVPFDAWCPVEDDGGVPVSRDCVAMYLTRKTCKTECDVSGGKTVKVRVEKYAPPTADVGPLTPSASLLCKLGSIIIHVEECVGPNGHVFDLTATKQLATDPEVVAWLAGMRAMAMLPVKR